MNTHTIKKILLLTIGVNVLCCIDSKEKDNKTVDLAQTKNYNISSYQKNIGFSVFGEQYFIPMETDTCNLLGEVKKVAASQEYVFMADNQKVVCFEVDENLQKGTIKYTVNNIGKGPEEYSEIQDYAINNLYLFIYDARKVNFYDVNSGKFIRSISLDFAAREIAAINDYLVFYTSSFQNSPANSYELFVLHTENNTLDKYFKNEKYLGSAEGSQLCETGDELFYCCPVRNVIYKFDEVAKPFPFMVLSTGPDNKIVDLTANPDLNNPEDLRNSDNYYFFGSLQKLKNYWSVQYCHKGSYIKAYMNIQDPEKGYISGASFSPQVVYKDRLISPVDSYNVASFDPQKFQNNPEALKMYSRVLDVTENDNPCLLVKEIL